jgi:hypothetical protein
MSEHAVNLQEKMKAFRPGTKPAELPEDDDHLCWGRVRGLRQSFNVEFRRLAGPWPALEYPWLNNLVWCPAATPFGAGVTIPSGSIVLHYSTGHNIAVVGRNLRMPHLKLLSHQVTYFAEADQPTADLADELAVVVTRIHIVEPADTSR